MISKRRELLFFTLFSLAVIAASFSILLSYWIFGDSYLEVIFFKSGKSIFTDFSDNYIQAQNFDAYSEHRIIYPPIVALFFRGISFALPDYLRDLEYSSRSLYQTAPISWIIYGIFIAVSVVIFAVSACKMAENYPWYLKLIILLCSVLTYPLMYAFQRGNTLILASSLIAFFLAFYKSKNILLNELSIIALSLSVSIKIYPIVFALFILKNKDWKSLLKAGFYTFVLLILPFIFYGGLDAMEQLFASTFRFTTSTSTDYSTKLFTIDQLLEYLGLIPSVAKNILSWFFILLFVILSFICRRKYQAFACYGIILLYLSSSRALYCISFLVPSLISFLSEEKDRSSFLSIIPIVLMLYLNGFYNFVSSINGFNYSFLIGSVLFLVIFLPTELWSFLRLRNQKNQLVKRGGSEV